MKILFLAPQPFFQERGTPIAVRLALQVLAARAADDVSSRIDLLTYHEGDEIHIPGVSLHRIPRLPFLRGIRPGLSWKKLLCDILFFFKAFSMVARRSSRPDLVHAVEESVFVAYLMQRLLGIPYIYDMDSSLALQVVDKWPLLQPFRPIMESLESAAIRNSRAVVPVCDSLAAIAERHNPASTVILRDVSLLADEDGAAGGDLRAEIEAAPDDVILLYVGNLEFYQGVDLLLSSFDRAAQEIPGARLVVIGGDGESLEDYRRKAARLTHRAQVHMLGSRPLGRLAKYLRQADILVSPRIRGNNTPMKIYSYLHSGRAVLATDIVSHNQVLGESVACLARPEEVEFSAAIVNLVRDSELRARLGPAGQALAEEKYTFQTFSRTLNELYDMVEREAQGSGPSMQRGAVPAADA